MSWMGRWDFWQSHVLLVVLGDDGYEGGLPGGMMDAESESSADDSDEGIWGKFGDPFPDPVCESGDAGGVVA